MRRCFHPAPSFRPILVPSLLLVIAASVCAHAAADNRRTDFFIPPIIGRNTAPVWTQSSDSLRIDGGDTVSVHLVATDPDDQLIQLSTLAMPDFVTLVDSGNGHGCLVVTPPSMLNGRFSMLVMAIDDSAAADTIDFTVIVSRLNRAPVWISPDFDSIAVTEGDDISLQLTATDPDGDYLYALVLGGLTPGIVSNGSGIFDLLFSPDYGSAGEYAISVFASDLVLTDTLNLLVTVIPAPPNHPPQWSTPEADSVGLREGELGVIQSHVTDNDGDALSISIHSELATALSDNGNGFFDLYVMPEVGETGRKSVVLVASDGRDSAFIEIIVQVFRNPRSNHPPEFVDVPSGVQLNVNRDTSIAVNAIDSDLDNLSFSGFYIPNFVEFVGRPFPALGDAWADLHIAPGSGHQGIFPVYLVASDGEKSDTAAVWITITNINYWPEIGEIPARTIDEGDTLEIEIVASDANSTTVTLSAFAMPAGATFVDHRNNQATFRFIPSYAQAGQYRVGFIANDGSLRDTVFLEITVLNLPRPPQLAAVSPKTVNEGSTIRIPLSATDPDNDPIALYSFDLPGNAAVHDSGNGRGDITFAPVIGQIGPFEMSVVATDGGLADTIVVIVTVLQTSVPPDSVAEVQFITEEVKKYTSAFTIDQLHTEDLNLDGIDEVLFRENVDGNHVLRIWSAAADSLWTLPPVGTGIKSYTLQSGTGEIEPVVWTNGNQLLGLVADHSGWGVIVDVPATATRVQLLPQNPEGWLAAYSVPEQYQSTFWAEPDGDCLGTATGFRTATYGYSPSDTSVKWGAGWAQQSAFDHGAMIQLFDQGLLMEVLISLYAEDEWYESCGMPSDRFYATFALYSFQRDSAAISPLWTHFKVSIDFMWSYGQRKPSPYNYGIGLSRWNDPSDTTLKVCFAGLPGSTSGYNAESPYALSIMSRGDVWGVSETRFTLPTTPTRGGVITVSDDELEAMLLAPDAGFGYVVSIPQAEFQGRLAMPAPGRFKTGYVRDASHRDMVFKVTNGVAVYRVKPYVPPRDSALVHHVPGDFPTIQAAINAALSGDTILVAPGSYPGSIDFLGKEICLKSVAGPQSTFILPASMTLPTVHFAGGESEAAIFDGFTIRLGSTSMVAIENNAKPVIRNNIFRESQGSGDILTIKSKGALITRNIFVSNANARCIAVGPSGSAQIINNTLDRNGAGISSENALTTCSNNIVTLCAGIGIRGDFAAADYNDVWSNNPNYDTRYLSDPDLGSHDLSVDPIFRSDMGGGVALSEYSLCIDNAHPALEYMDSDGSYGDIGAIPFIPVGYPRAMNVDLQVADRWHLTDDAPIINWSYFDFGQSVQVAYEIEVASDNSWPGADAWSTGTVTSGASSVAYSGIAFIRGHDYFMRVRVNDGSAWGPWSYEGFHVNGLPPLPVPMFPLNNTFVTAKGSSLIAQIEADPEGDSVLCEFYVYDSPDFSVPFAAFSKVTRGPGVVTSGTLNALAPGRTYWWSVRVSDELATGQLINAQKFSTTASSVKVPSQQPNLTDALKAVSEGDTILVEPGTYSVNLIVPSLGITILSTDGAAATTLRPIDATKPTIYFSGRPLRTTLEGFTITGSDVFAIEVYNSQPRILRNVIVSNVGAIRAEYSDNLNVSENTFIDNGIVSQTHAALDLQESDSISISRNLIYDGQSNGQFFLKWSSGKITNNTIVVTRGYGVYVRQSRIAMYNNIVTGAVTRGVQTYRLEDLSADYNCEFDNATDYEGFVPGPGSIFVDPQFVNPAAGDFRLAAGSPCIDAGHPDPQYNDPDGSRNDIGAYPFVPGISALAPDDFNGDGVVDVRDAVMLIDQTVRSAGATTADMQRAERVRALVERLWGHKAQIQK